MLFKTDDLKMRLMDDEYVILIDRGHSRWSSLHTMVFEHEGKHYGADYEQGLTEQQDTFPFEDSPEETECPEYESYVEPVTMWRKKRAGT